MIFIAEKVKFNDRLMHAWNVFRGRDPDSIWARRPYEYGGYGGATSTRPDRARMRQTNERSVVSAIYTRIAIDVSQIVIQHVKQDHNGRYTETVHSGLNNCLTIEANIDQTGKEFMRDVVLSMFDEGSVAVIPVDTDDDPDGENKMTGSYDVLTLRTGRITAWYPKMVTVELYNEETGIREEITLPKKMVAIIENPLYPIMNEPNSTLKRLIHKLNLLDSIDEQSSSGKLDIIIQLPYVIRGPQKREQAETRRKDIEMQLSGSKYGIAYIDGTERITQLNRPSENNLMKQVEYLTNMVYSQLGITTTIFDGTADEKTMLNYQNRSITPIVDAIVDSLKRTFLTKTARTQGHTIMAFRDAFKLVPATELANMADKFTRNEILSSNEIRAIIGFKPSVDPKADELRNKNLNQSNNSVGATVPTATTDTSTPIDTTVSTTASSGTNQLTTDQMMGLFEELLASVESDVDNILGEDDDGVET